MIRILARFLFQGMKGTGGVSYTVGGASAPPTFRFAPPTLYSAPPTFVRLDCFLALNEHFPLRARKAIGLEDFLAPKFLFAMFSENNHQLIWHFAPTNFFRKAPPMMKGLKLLSQSFVSYLRKSTECALNTCPGSDSSVYKDNARLRRMRLNLPFRYPSIIFLNAKSRYGCTLLRYFSIHLTTRMGASELLSPLCKPQLSWTSAGRVHCGTAYLQAFTGSAIYGAHWRPWSYCSSKAAGGFLRYIMDWNIWTPNAGYIYIYIYLKIYNYVHGRRMVSKVGVAKHNMINQQVKVGVTNNDKRAKCWCGMGKVGVATATPAIRHSPPMIMLYIQFYIIHFIDRIRLW